MLAVSLSMDFTSSECNPTMSAQFNSNAIPNSSTEDYIQAIKSCFTKQTVVSPYFYQLIDYIQSDSTNAQRITPVPTAIQIRGSSDIASQSDARAMQPWGLDIQEKDIDKTQAPCLITIEGLPSPSCIAYIGSKYGLRPEYWLSNLSFGRQNPTQSYFFELPNLPSRRHNIVQVLIPMLGRQTGGSYSTHLSALERLEAKHKLDEWDRQLLHHKKFGATRMRKLHLHNSEFFSIEQLVSFSVYARTPDSWIGKWLVPKHTPS